LGFPGGPLNIVPDNSLLNNGAYFVLEHEIRLLHNSSARIDVEFVPTYNSGNITQRPDSFTVKYRVEVGKFSILKMSQIREHDR